MIQYNISLIQAVSSFLVFLGIGIWLGRVSTRKKKPKVTLDKLTNKCQEASNHLHQTHEILNELYKTFKEVENGQ